MINKLMILVTLFSISIPSFAQNVDTAWVRRHDGPGNSEDRAQAIAADDSGNVYVTGYSDGGGTHMDYATIKYCPNGDVAPGWPRRYNGPGNNWDEAYAVTVDDSGNVYVTGWSDGSGSYEDYLTIKYYPNGDVAPGWPRRYNGPESTARDVAWAIAVDDSGHVYVSGDSYVSGTYSDYCTIKYNPNGDVAPGWPRRYNGPGNLDDQVNAMTIDDSGNVYVTGYSHGSGTSADYATIKYYADGNTAWEKRYNGLGNGWDHARDIVVDNSTNIYVTGSSHGSGTFDDYLTIKYYPDGDTAWVRSYDGPGSGTDIAYAIAVDDSGNAYVTGSSWGSGTSEDYATIKYYPDGDTAWTRIYNGPGDSTDGASTIALDGSGNIYVGGTSYGGIGTHYDYAIIKYYPNGEVAPEWPRRYNGPGNDYDNVRALAVDGIGNVYVTGYSASVGAWPDYLDYATIKYVQGIGLVSITDDAFVPQTDTISVGDSVRWTNNGTVPHTSTSDTKSSWDSGTLNPGESFTFQFESDGVYPYHCTLHPSMVGTIVVLATDVEDETGSRQRPVAFTLSQNYPNPFNQATKIEFTLAKPRFVSLGIYDVLGRTVRTLVSENVSPGYKSVLWDGKNDRGVEAASGVYFYQIRAGDLTETKKMLLLK